MLRRQHLLAISLVSLLMLPLSSAWAVDETLLSTGRITTHDISAFPSDEQLRSALAQVLIRVSGQSNITDREAARFLLQDAGRFMQQFSFVPLSEPDAQGMANELEIQFDWRSLAEEMRELGMPVLMTGRPTVLLWLAEEQGGRRDFVDSSDELIQSLRQGANQRGLPLLLPILDLTDQQALPVGDLWGFFSAPLQQASVRYAPDLVMAARVTGSGDATQIQASIWTQGAQQILQASGDRPVAARQLMDQIADIALQADMVPEPRITAPLPGMHRPQAVQPIQPIQPVASGASPQPSVVSEPFSEAVMEFTPPGILVTIHGLEGPGAYLEVTNLLRGLNGVQSVLPATLMQDSAQVRLMYDGSSAELEQLLNQEPRLQRRSGGSSLEYVWN
ncbi:DUF2066 domain-containing protein [Nitrincola alkalilacustris]|uniref:DUF2066 domain-containing protein n=1 Tax=Nitrincola alkalilacustris TaxID=1571224 RepID=UPI00124E4ABB|nr:DUF2066 domain-containing protein [Nitrincola alkalilacustris]